MLARFNNELSSYNSCVYYEFRLRMLKGSVAYLGQTICKNKKLTFGEEIFYATWLSFSFELQLDI